MGPTNHCRLRPPPRSEEPRVPAVEAAQSYLKNTNLAASWAAAALQRCTWAAHLTTATLK
ncbi:UNVERIFIED_CONTAM: hypothetical protein Slati_1050100 [Sesamum latifolium]|uniref:Uncharacterized protein n=1 Tax=Sesamum latifolium TaxID=2727402 RepID=A0AAW2XVG7_9LAMI